MNTKDENRASPTGFQALIARSLFASILLNLFLAAALVAPQFMHHRPFGPMALTLPHGGFMVENMARVLNPEDAAAFKEAYNAEAEALQQGRDDMREAAEKLTNAFEADPADPVAMQTALDHLKLAHGRLHAALGKMLQDVHAKLSPEGRHRLAELKRDHAM